MWICEKHKNENKDALENFKDEYQKNHKLLLGLFSTPIQISVQSPGRKNKIAAATESPSKSEESRPSMLEASKEEDKIVNSKAANSHKNISTKAATRKLRRKISLGGESVEVRPIPAGRAQFMIGHWPD